MPFGGYAEAWRLAWSPEHQWGNAFVAAMLVVIAVVVGVRLVAPPQPGAVGGAALRRAGAVPERAGGALEHQQHPGHRAGADAAGVGRGVDPAPGARRGVDPHRAGGHLRMVGPSAT